MTCEALRAQAAGIAALPEGDPEREAFLAHARGCAGCMEALRKGEQLMRLLDSVPMPAPSPEALRRASDPLLATLSTDWTKKKLFFSPRRAWTLPAGAAVGAFGLLLLVARRHDPEAWGAALLVAALSAVLAATAGVLRAGALVGVAASAALALAAGGAPGFAFAGQMGGLVPGLGFECLITEMVSAALPLAAAAWLFRRNPRPGALAQAAAAGALAGQAALHVACSAHTQSAHLWVFHVGGVALAALAGWLAENRLVSVKG